MLKYVGSAHTVTTINASRRAIARNYSFGRRDGQDIDIPLTYTPLVWAAILDNDIGVKMLIRAGADTNSRTSGNGHTALTAQSILSSRPGNQPNSLSLLLNGGSSRDIFDQGPLALGNALIFSNGSLAVILIEAGAPVNMPCVDGLTPLQFCSRMGNNPDIRVIISMLRARTF